MTERGLAGLAVGVLALQLAAAALPVWTAAGPSRSLDPAAAAFGRVPEGVTLARSDEPGLRARIACASGARCRVDAAWPVGWSTGAVRAEAAGVVEAGAARVVLVGKGRRTPTGWAPGAGAAQVAVPGDPPPDRLVVALLGSGATIDLRRLSVGPARRSPLRVAVLTAWWTAAGALVARGARSVGATVDRAAGAPLAALSLVVALGIAMPSEWLHGLLLTIPGTRPEDLHRDLFTDPTVAMLAQKVGGHGLGFALLAALALRAGAGVRRTAAWLLLVALLTESVQALLPDRSARIADVGVDLAGAAIGALGWGMSERLRTVATNGSQG